MTQRRQFLVHSAGMLGALLAPPVLHAENTSRFSIGERDFLLDGKPFQIRCGEMHFSRIPREYWRHRLQAAKAMGLNTVCAYLFWNFHEWRAGCYDWSEQRDAAAFCRIAQEEGLWVVLRPGPYSCAEWEMGGLPWWLLKHEGQAFLRTRDPAFLEPAQRWLREVGRVMGSLQVTRGGPILMVQVENEYGFFGTDLDYLRTLRNTMLDAGFEVPLFQCNPTDLVQKTHMPELFSVANFGSDPAAGFAALRAVQSGPAMCGEYYSGWFDTWGAPHRKGDNQRAVQDIAAMLGTGGSFSLYMAHGGTSFGLWGGCDRPFRPDTTSYDYDAPIDEAGGVGVKFALYRNTIARFLAPGETLPPPPAKLPVMSLPTWTLTETAPVWSALPSIPRRVGGVRPIEQDDVSRGLIAYRITLSPGPAARLEAGAVRDLAWAFLDGQPIGTMDARYRRFSLDLPARAKPATLDLLVYTIARVNFGLEMHDRKGLHGALFLRSAGGDIQTLEQWEMRALDFDADAILPPLNWQVKPAHGPAFWRGRFQLAAQTDTFLDMSDWGMGIVWINGRCLGRYWSIGPTQTMYLPGPWLHVGENEVIVLDLTGPHRPALRGLTAPILDQRHPERDLKRPAETARPRLKSLTPLHSGEFAPGSGRQEVRFTHTARGRQFCLEALDAHDGKPYAAVAELALLDANGQPLNQTTWEIVFVDSEESMAEDGTAMNAINGQVSDHWHTAYSGKGPHPGFPHRLVIDLGTEVEIGGLLYTPRQGARGVTGRIRHYRVYLGENLVR